MIKSSAIKLNYLINFLFDKKNFRYLILSFIVPLFFNNSNLKIEAKEEEKIISEYLLGPTDLLKIEYKSLYIYSGYYGIDLNGNLDLPEIGRTNVLGLTINELETLLEDKYKSLIKIPEISVAIHKYRPLTIYISGEVKKPGLYTFTYDPAVSLKSNNFNADDFMMPKSEQSLIQLGRDIGLESAYSRSLELEPLLIPKLFDAVKRSGGVTNHADLSSIKIIRKNSNTYGGGDIETTVDFIKLLSIGDQSQNIRIFDGDSIIIPKSVKPIKEQIILATNSNLTPDQISVFITGNVELAGTAKIPKGSSLVQAISSSGGKKIFTGKIEFIRFSSEGLTEKRIFKYNPNSPINSRTNPILMNGDVIYVRKTILGKTSEVLKEFSSPLLPVVGIYSIFN